MKFSYNVSSTAPIIIKPTLIELYVGTPNENGLVPVTAILTETRENGGSVDTSLQMIPAAALQYITAENGGLKIDPQGLAGILAGFDLEIAEPEPEPVPVVPASLPDGPQTEPEIL